MTNSHEVMPLTLQDQMLIGRMALDPSQRPLALKMLSCANQMLSLLQDQIEVNTELLRVAEKNRQVAQDKVDFITRALNPAVTK